MLCRVDDETDQPTFILARIGPRRHEYELARHVAVAELVHEMAADSEVTLVQPRGASQLRLPSSETSISALDGLFSSLSTFGVQPGELRPIDRIGRVRAPLLVASGSADDRTPLVEAQALFDRAPQPKYFWAVQAAAHVDLERFNPEAYWSVVLPFLNDTLRGSNQGSAAPGEYRHPS